MPRQKYKFCFTLDTEPDNLWDFSPTVTFEHFERLPEFHHRLVEAGARPTYLTTSEVAEDPSARSSLLRCLSEGVAEIGAHFHTWTRQWPFRHPELGSPPLQAMAHQLGAGVEEQMLDFTCSALRGAFGGPVTSYRGGRWSFGRQSPRSLANCGILVDSSFTPGLSWSDAKDRLVDGTDYRRAGRRPSWLVAPGADHRPVLELPVGAAWFPEWAWKLKPELRRYLGGVRTRLGMRGGHRWLRPTRTSVADMRAVMESLKRDDIPVWVFMIHSSEIIPCRPLPTTLEVDRFIERCASGVRAAVELGAEPVTLSEALDWYARVVPPQSSAESRDIVMQLPQNA
jgi:hypothetical protein